MSPSPPFSSSQIPGNALPEVKQLIFNWFNRFFSSPDEEPGFADSVGRRLRVTEVSINTKADSSGEGKKECRVVCETTVESDMLNGGRTMHGACSAFLIDKGDKLRIVSTTIAVGSRIMSARSEIWNDTHQRLVASAVHIKMEPSVPATKL